MFRKSLLFRVLIVVLIMLALSAWTLQEPEDPTDFVEVLTWLAAGPLAVFVAGQAVSYALEQIPAWGSGISSGLRRLIVLLLAVVLAVGANLLLANAELVQFLENYYRIAFNLAAAWLGTQLAYGRQAGAGMLATREP